MAGTGCRIFRPRKCQQRQGTVTPHRRGHGHGAGTLRLHRSPVAPTIDHSCLGVDHDIALQRAAKDQPCRPERQDRTQRQMQDIHLQTVTVFPALGQRNAPRSHVHSAVAAMTLVALVAAMALVALVAAMTLVALVAAMTLVAAIAVVVLVASLVMFHLAMVWVPHTGVFFGGRP